MVVTTLFCRREQQALPYLSFGLGAKKHMKPVKDREPNNLDGEWISAKARSKGKKYITKYKQMHGEEFDPMDGPFDPKMSLIANGGRMNGRMGVHVDLVQTSKIPIKTHSGQFPGMVMMPLMPFFSSCARWLSCSSQVC